MGNETNIILYAEDATQPMFKYFNAEYEACNTQPDKYLLAIMQNGDVKAISGHLHASVTNIYQLINNHVDKEKLFLTAVDNLIKKNDFLQLSIQLDQELISEDEFREELERNEVKYLIKMNPDFKLVDFNLGTELLSKLNRQFTSDDASELFSIPLEHINNYLDTK